jgi:ketosteroid isomerase-like protein
MLKTISFLLAVTMTRALIASPVEDSPRRARTEEQIWNLEKAYWDYVKTNDLDKYRALWHDNFVGWPFVSPEPVRKDQITDWITNNTSKGLKLQSYSIEQLALRVTGDIAIDHYRIKVAWGKGDTGEGARTDAFRITHTWIRTGDTFQIIGGMSAPVNEKGK